MRSVLNNIFNQLRMRSSGKLAPNVSKERRARIVLGQASAIIYIYFFLFFFVGFIYSLSI
jgi:hypothetical protein